MQENFQKAWNQWIYEHHRIKNVGDVMWRHWYRGTITKAEDVSPEDFYKRYGQMWSVCVKIPKGRLPTPDEQEKKAIFYYANPRRYRVKFQRCGHDLWDKEIDFVADFMHTLFRKRWKQASLSQRQKRS